MVGHIDSIAWASHTLSQLLLEARYGSYGKFLWSKYKVTVHIRQPFFDQPPAFPTLALMKALLKLHNQGTGSSPNLITRDSRSFSTEEITIGMRLYGQHEIGNNRAPSIMLAEIYSIHGNHSLAMLTSC